MQRLRALRRGLHPRRSPSVGSTEPLRLPPRRLSRTRLHRLRHLLLCLPRTGRHHRVLASASPPWPDGITMPKQLIKGNEAIVKGAVLAGCRAFYGYPITPASEIAEAAASTCRQAGGIFLQAESEVAAINMLYGAASAGVRSMTASSGPGISLMQEGISYLAGAELPCVIADIMRGGPGPGQHRARAERLQPGGQRRRPRQLSHPGAGARLRAGDGRPHHPRLRPRRPISQSRVRARRRLHRPDDGAGRVPRPRDRAPAPPDWAVRGNAGNAARI